MALGSVAEVDLAGIDRSSAGYLDAVAAEGLTRSGRWTEAATLLARHPEPDNLPVGEIRLGRSRAMLAARLGRPTTRPRPASSQPRASPIDPWHEPLLARGGSRRAPDPRGPAPRRPRTPRQGAEVDWRRLARVGTRFAMFSAPSPVEQTLDAQARQEPVDVTGTTIALRSGSTLPPAAPRTADGAAHLACIGLADAPHR